MSKQIIWDTKMVEEAIEKMNNGFVLSRLENPFFDNVIGLKKTGITFKMSNIEQSEYINCALDIQHFAETYCYIKGEEGEPIIVPLRDYQKEILDNFYNNRFNILMASRQTGKCFSFNTIICIQIENKSVYMQIGNFYYMIISSNRKLTLMEKLKIKLYNIIFKIEKGKLSF